MSNYISYRARFQGKLAGVTIEELKGLDYEKVNLIERIEEVLNKLDKVEPFFNEYFFQKEKDDRDNGEFEHLITENDKREFYRYSPNTTDELSEDINICKIIQSYASYILNSKDLPKEKQQEYKVLSEDRFKKILQRERAMSNISSEGDEDLEGLSMEQIILDTRPTNDYNNLDLRITSKDLDTSKQNNKYGVREKDKYLAVVLGEYVTMLEFLKTELTKIKNGEKSKYALYELVGLMSNIKKDMLLAKKQILGIRDKAKRLGDESPYNDYSTMDYNNPEHIKYILKFCRITSTPRPDDMMSHIGYDVYTAINTLKKEKRLDRLDLEIIECYNVGYSERDIASEVNRDRKVVSRRLDKICRRISEVI